MRIRPHPGLAACAVAAVMLTGTGLPPAPVALAQDDPGLTLPTAETHAADLALVPDDAPAIAPASFDSDAAGDVALANVDRFAGPDWDIADVARQLGPEPEAAFAWVRDHIGFDPYPGVLRGAHGTLVARAGNAWDRAILLQALLLAQGHEARLASGTLDDAAAREVLARALAGPAQPLPDPEATVVLGTDLASITTRARRDHALLVEGLREHLADLGGGDTPDPLAAVRAHAWVQLVADDGTVTDLDPTLAAAEAGSALALAAETMDVPPADLHHGLRVAVVVETLTDGALSERILLDAHLDAAEAADDETWLTFQAESGGIGGAILDALSDVSWAPILSVNGEDMKGASFAVSSSGDVGDSFFGEDDSFLGEGEGGAGELASLRLELTSEAPGLEPISARRVLLDRVPPADRAAGTIAAERLAAMPPPGEPLPALAAIHQVLVSNGGADLRAHAVNRAIAIGWGATLQNDPAQAEELKLFDLLYPLAVANQSLVLTSEQVLTDGIGVEGEARAFVGRPRGYLVSFERHPEVPEGSAIVTDLALDGVEVVTAEGAPTDLAARVRLWHGALAQALETELSLARAAAVSPDTVEAWSVSLEMDGPPRLITPDGAEAVAPERAALRDALAGGQLALEVAGSPHGSFWAVEPVTGRTRSVGEPGLRIGFIGGGNYVNSSGGGPRYVVDPKTGNTLGTIQDGRFTPANRTPPSRCSGGTEYVVILGCVSIPAGMTVGMVYGVIVTAIVSWATVILMLV